MLQCTVLPAENNWTNIDFYVAIIVSFSINRYLYAQLFATIPLSIYRLQIYLQTKQTKQNQTSLETKFSSLRSARTGKGLP